MPVHGIRVLTVLRPDGQIDIEWLTHGKPTLDELVAMLSRLTFLVQAAEFYVFTHGEVNPLEDDEDADENE
jgi:hypothetical protein